MKIKNIIIVAAVGMTLTGCGIYNKYEQKTPTPADAFGSSQDVKQASGEQSMAQMSWREFFTDPLLQQLIEQVLANN
ncbi:MAG: TolC family protein, partial [Prevotella sp.]|nr:TolC family protein [Prevotella sp.]